MVALQREFLAHITASNRGNWGERDGLDMDIRAAHSHGFLRREKSIHFMIINFTILRNMFFKIILNILTFMIKFNINVFQTVLIGVLFLHKCFLEF